MYQDLPEFADRISIVGHHNRTGRMKNFTHEKLKQRLARTDVLQKEWQEALEHEYKDRSPYNYPLFGVEKSTAMLREENYQEPDLIIYGQILIQMTGVCFTTLHNFRRILLRQFGKMDFDIEDIYATPPDQFKIEYRDERTVEFEKYKRNIVLLHINSYELSALVRQIAEFCPEGVTVTMSEIADASSMKFSENQEAVNLKKLVDELEKIK